MKDYLGRFLTKQEENAGALKSGNRQNRQKVVRPADEKSGRAYGEQPTKPTKGSQTVRKGAFVGFVGSGSKARSDFSAASTPEAAPVQALAQTAEPPAERPRSGSIARPMVARGDRMLADCLWSKCDGKLAAQGGALYLCSDCGTWFELQPADFGVYVGDLAGDVETEWVM